MSRLDTVSGHTCPYDEKLPSIKTAKRLQRKLKLKDTHVVFLGDTGFTIAHTDEERATIDLEDCPLHKWLWSLTYAPARPSRRWYTVTEHEWDRDSEAYPVSPYDFTEIDGLT